MFKSNEQIKKEARFWRLVDIKNHRNNKQCWNWQGYVNIKTGYGQFGSATNGTLITAHRFVASLSGDIEDKVVMHICDNRRCVNPDHLIIATQQDNLRDMIRKGRSPNQKLSLAAVQHIRAKELRRKDYATLYGVSETHITRIQKNESWTGQ